MLVFFLKDNYYEEAFKMRNVLEEFHAHKGQRKPTILGLREHIFTGRFALLQYLVKYLILYELIFSRPSKHIFII